MTLGLTLLLLGGAYGLVWVARYLWLLMTADIQGEEWNG